MGNSGRSNRSTLAAKPDEMYISAARRTMTASSLITGSMAISQREASKLAHASAGKLMVCVAEGPRAKLDVAGL